jgi:hypothetical protein
MMETTMKSVLLIRRWSMRLPLSRGQGARANTLHTQKSLESGGDATVKIPFAKVARIRPQESVGAMAAALLAGAAIGGWVMSTMSTTSAAAVEDMSAVEMMRKNVINNLPHDELKHRLIGSYVVRGTDPDGRPYAGAGIVDIALAPSGALELDWDNGKQVGVAQVIGDVLVVACLIKGRTAILMMTINPDGSLSGKWSRRTDRGQKGTETWTKA